MHIGCPQRLIAVIALVGSASASALGFGSVRSSVVLGQPLNLAIPVSLAEGETLAADCASAEVTAGEGRLPPGTVRVRVTQGRDASESVLRITTTTVVEEPVVNVTVSAGCPTRLTRTLVLLADPPTVITTTAEAPSLPVTGGAARAAPNASVAGGANLAEESQARRDARPPAPARPRPARAAPRSSAAPPAPRPAAVVVAAAPAAASATPRSAPAAPASTASRPVARADSRPRLQLDSGQVSVAPPAAMLAAQEQVSAARASASAAEAAASAANERMRSMEAELGRVRQEAKAQTDALVQLRQQLALDRAQRDPPTMLTNALAVLAALLLLLVAWLFLRLRRQTRAEKTRADWWDREATGMGASATEASSSAFSPSTSASGAGALRPPGPAAAASQRIPSAPAPWSDSIDSRSNEVDLLISPLTVPAPTAVTIPSLAPLAPRVEEADRAMSVDEQIDLEQQADFFIALGHDDAAIDLLMAHMRSTGGASPLPFLKLLEIHRRRNQREAYERTRVRFNQRFNSVAPDWQADPKLGRKLEDYQLAIGRIQRAWPSPLDAMAELEALLFRRGGGAESFDLPAYQEVLFLYQMARDLRHAESAGSGSDVDVLLPIGGRSLPMTAPEGMIVLRPELNDGEPLALSLEGPAFPASPEPEGDLDLDLSTRPGDGSAALDELPAAAPVPSNDLLEPSRDEDFWGSNPDARPTR